MTEVKDTPVEEVVEAGAAEDIERHKFPRNSVLLPAVLSVGEQEVACEILNLSDGGAKVRLSDPIECSETAVLTIEPHGALICSTAWQNGHFVGLAIDTQDEKQQAVLQEIIANPESSSDRRDYPRTSVLWSGRIHAAGRVAECRVLNISALGAKVRLLESLQHGTEVSLMIDRFGEFPSDVVWQEGEYLGINFRDEPEDIVRIVEPALPAIRGGTEPSA
ncbi:MAG: PilZ domain-containing protein [Pseudomonadota bacterium]